MKCLGYCNYLFSFRSNLTQEFRCLRNLFQFSIVWSLLRLLRNLACNMTALRRARVMNGFSFARKYFKRNKIDHPGILLNNTPVRKVEEHKHLGLVLDSKLSFSAHIKTAITKARRSIGLLRYLSKYLPRQTLSELYKLYVRPHLDYGDVIYHILAKVSEFSCKATSEVSWRR